MKVDYIFGLSEMIHRLDNTQANSILVIEYGGKYQCRSYVVLHAIDKGWRSDEIAKLIDFMSTGRVVFFSKPHYVGVVSREPREMTGEEMIAFQSAADPTRRGYAEEMVDIVEAAAQRYLDAFHEHLNDWNADPIRAGQFDLIKVDDPNRD